MSGKVLIIVGNAVLYILARKGFNPSPYTPWSLSMVTFTSHSLHPQDGGSEVLWNIAIRPRLESSSPRKTRISSQHEFKSEKQHRPMRRHDTTQLSKFSIRDQSLKVEKHLNPTCHDTLRFASGVNRLRNTVFFSAWRRVEEWRCNSKCFYLHNRWSTSRPGHFTPGKEPTCPLDRKLGGPQNSSGRSGKRKIPVPAGNQTTAIQPVAQPLHWLSYRGRDEILVWIVYFNYEWHFTQTFIFNSVNSAKWKDTWKLIRAAIRWIQSSRNFNVYMGSFHKMKTRRKVLVSLSVCETTERISICFALGVYNFGSH
jgi:hypothetical protein